ncbi:EH signature domain-containing protein [Neorhizobium sp. BETTINA12A]|uniref:EH signature domain-containing protein n=1 Tax=Neorhizobium sp. BETTINA12A TaxID=2908924 RepID=UPI001FF28B88|nr:EH signature domain-containing protein [Neorhizobium sp. BETTINA12A]MCJ9751632.1 EH signature domain-containing protein [Neorhizobium sp. BETTINA12A]
MSLLDALRSRQRVKTRDIWNTEKFDSAAFAVSVAFPGYEKTPTLSLDEVISRLESGVERWNFDDIKIGDVALAIKAAFSRQVKISNCVRDFLRGELDVTTNPVFLQALCEVYLEFWERGAAETAWIAKVVQDQARSLPPNWVRCFRALPDLLNPATAPELIAMRMVAEKDAFQWLLSHGIAAPHSGELMRLSHIAWLDALPEPKTVEQVQNISAWMLPVGRPPLEGEPAAKCVEKLLQPWLKVKPDSDVQTTLLDSLVQTYGDPRNQRAEFWPLVSLPHRRVVIRWLAGQSMDALLSIITQSTLNHMWPPRHSFWKGLYDKGLIDEAWVALSPSARADAEAMFQKTGDPVYTMTSKQVARTRKDTCLLIMRIGRYTVLEGSHSYRLHVFHSTDQAAPELYEDEYDAEALTLEVGHRDTCTHDAYGQWMRWAEQRLLR